MAAGAEFDEGEGKQAEAEAGRDAEGERGGDQGKERGEGFAEIVPSNASDSNSRAQFRRVQEIPSERQSLLRDARRSSNPARERSNNGNWSGDSGRSNRNSDRRPLAH